MTKTEQDYTIEDLEDTLAAINSHANVYRQYQSSGDRRQLEMIKQSFCEAHSYLVRTFGVQTAAEAETLLSSLKNGNYQAHLNSGVFA